MWQLVFIRVALISWKLFQITRSYLPRPQNLWSLPLAESTPAPLSSDLRQFEPSEAGAIQAEFIAGAIGLTQVRESALAVAAKGDGSDRLMKFIKSSSKASEGSRFFSHA